MEKGRLKTVEQMRGFNFDLEQFDRAYSAYSVFDPPNVMLQTSTLVSGPNKPPS